MNLKSKKCVFFDSRFKFIIKVRFGSLIINTTLIYNKTTWSVLYGGAVFSIRGRGLQTSNHPSYQSQNAKNIWSWIEGSSALPEKIPAVLTSSCKSLGFHIASCHVLPKSLVKRKEISWAEREIKLWTLGSVPSYVPIFAETPLGLCHRPSCDRWRCKSSPCIWDDSPLLDWESGVLGPFKLDLAV